MLEAIKRQVEVNFHVHQIHIFLSWVLGFETVSYFVPSENSMFQFSKQIIKNKKKEKGINKKMKERLSFV